MTTLKVGAKAPDFALLDQRGNVVALSSQRGKKVVLYFYVRDNTPGCTREACDLRDHYRKLSSKDTVVLGVSPDSVESHAKFAAKYKLPFQILSDPKKKAAKLYGVYRLKTMYGKKKYGIVRSTFIINEKGNIEKIFSPVKSADNIEMVLQSL